MKRGDCMKCTKSTKHAIIAPMDVAVILNPNAGSAEEIDNLRQRLARHPSLELWETSGPGDARKLARRAIEGRCRTVVAAGGDGTLNEVLNGLAADFACSRLGILPLGTGNDFVRSIGIPADPEEALDVIEAGQVRRIDVARADFGDGGGVRHFLNMSAGGFSNAVGEEMDSETKKRWGGLAYALAAVRVLGELEPYQTRIVLDRDEVIELPLYLLLIANARYVASGVPAAPSARLDDGRLELVAFPEMEMGDIAALVPRTLLGLHEGSERVTVRRARHIEIHSDPPLPLNVDGEACGDTPVTFESLPGVLEVLAPPRENPEDA